ncbi:bifunctional pyr operon transcriptional regulator/uracil phosphoribosyltransferase PyrR [Thiomicrorhabdus sp.]|uniref:bifunctional pyr operon transcriptional regulator/uracil phosphoribosyltransferase PyrR n=1 Tax=Thiomicrorhabdus sp. TaxID=2039724 RepID=UPI0029C7CBBF|nr:bifunctional pyr operon transcriptional regulator/uracil phosphoribosyltransferase PyrR [Thiomicrorhabdus sp.]
MNADQINVADLIERIAEQLQNHPIMDKQPKMIGIRTGGEWIAQALHDTLGLTDELGILDTAFFRDDIARTGLSVGVQPSLIPWEIQDQHLILVDDVLYTGRTGRAALNEIFDFGRPASVLLVALLEREGGRELPIQADIVGQKLTSEHKLKLNGPEPLSIAVLDENEDSL